MLKFHIVSTLKVDNSHWESINWTESKLVTISIHVTFEYDKLKTVQL